MRTNYLLFISFSANKQQIEKQTNMKINYITLSLTQPLRHKKRIPKGSFLITDE